MAINFDHQRDRISTSSGLLDINTTGALRIPVGNTAQQPANLLAGQIRFNSQQQSFEGYNGAGWSSLGGVRDIDGNTYVIAETAPGVNNNEIDFYTDGTQRMQIGATGNFLLGDTLTEFTIDGATGDTEIAGNVTVNTDKFLIDSTTGDTTIAGNLQVDGTLTVEGIATLKAGTSGTINVGDDNTDNVVFNADVNSNVIPNTDATYDLGSALQNWNTIHVQTLDSNTESIVIDTTGSLILPVGTVAERPITPTEGMIRYNSDDTTFEGYDGTAWGSLGGVKDVDQDTYIAAEDSPGANNDELDFYTAGVQRMTIDSTGQITAADTYTPVNPQDLVTVDFAENSISTTAGTPTDGTWQDGAYLGFTDTDKVVDVLDELNEALNNVRNNTFVRSVTFTANPTSAGAGTTVTLTLNVDGNANKYDIDWGDGGVTTGTTDSTPSYIYTSNVNSPFTVTVRAYNSNADAGTAGSEASVTNVDYITIFTTNTSSDFELYRLPTAGTALLGNDLYVIEGDSLYMDNNTPNTSGATVSYSMDWGDGTSPDIILSDNDPGGVNGIRLQHTWGAGTSTGIGRDSVTLILTSHSTADPSTIPSSATIPLKVYDPNISAPDGLSTKTISLPISVGTSPKLAAGFTNNNTSTTLAGSDINRQEPTGTVDSSIISTYAYDADTGTLSALVNGAADGVVTFDGANNSGTYTSLVVTEEEDYNLLDETGSSITFDSSIYHPGLYTGFKARVSKTGASIATGTTSYQLSHSATGDTNTIEFVMDDVTSTPTVVAGVLAENVGNYKYISGIPYYDTGSSLELSGVTLDNFIGQTYSDITDVVTVNSGANYEGTSGSSVTAQNYTYSNIDGVSSFLTGSIPNANTGNGTPYAIGDLIVNITNSSEISIENLTVTATNVNGTGSPVSMLEKVQVHTAAQSGISEIAIDVSNTLGATYADNGVRSFAFSSETTDNPAINSATNYYTTNVYTEAADPGVTGTQEATIRLGVLEHNVEDYSTGFLPVGPNRTADIGIQYFTFAFRRTAVSNFTINITSTTGISGLWIAAPGTTIDNTSTINGWLDCGIQFNGAGVPGADIGAGGNGSNGCAVTGADVVANNTPLSGGYTMTLSTESLTNATGNVALVRIALNTNQSITGLSIT